MHPPQPASLGHDFGDLPLLDSDEEEDEEWAALGDEGHPGSRAALFSSQASFYARYRPGYPPHIYQRIYDFAAAANGGNSPSPANPAGLALDIGCGPGNVAVELAKTYAQVIGVDPSRDQLDHAVQRPNIRYLQTAAEYLAEHLPPQSVDLIAIAETLHWLDCIRFYEQARVILKPTGVLAIWCYDLSEFAASAAHTDAAGLFQANALMRAFTYTILGPFWDSRRVYIDRRYAGLEPAAGQFGVVERVDTRMEHGWSLDHFIGFLRSWSPYAAYRKTYPGRDDPLVDLRAKLKRLLHVDDDAAPTLRISFPVFMLLVSQPVQ